MMPIRYVRADLHNHFTTRSRVLDPNRVADRVREALGEGGICALVNYDDQRYEAFARGAERASASAVNFGNAIHFQDRDVIVVKGEEIPAAEGDLLVLGLREGNHLPQGKPLRDSIDDSNDQGGIVIITTPYFMSRVGDEIRKNHKILSRVHAIEVHDGQVPAKANLSAEQLHKRRSRSGYLVGRLSSSDGHTFREVGGSWTTLEIPEHYTDLKKAEDVSQMLIHGIRKTGYEGYDGYYLPKILPWQRKRSRAGFVLHTGIIFAMVAASKVGINISRGDPEALR